MTYATTGKQQIFGRDSEIQTLKEAYERVVKTGYGEIVLVGGPPGSGKTSVVNTFLSSGHNLNFVHAKADEAYKWVPYKAVLKALDYFLPEGSVDDIMSIRDLTTPVSASQVRERLIVAIRAHTSPERPLIVFIDDLHWLDEGSVQLIRDMSERGMRDMLLIGTYRKGDASEFERTGIASLIGDPAARVTDISLNTLAYEAVEGLISSQRFGETSKPLARLVQSVAGGNPFHIQLILNVLDQAEATPDLAHFVADQKNWGLDSLLGKLVGSLPEETRRMLQIASCMGFASDVSQLASIGAVQSDDWERIFRAASSIGLVGYDERSFQFTHDSVREHVRRSMSKNLRTRTHATIAVSMLRSGNSSSDQHLAVAEQIIKAQGNPVIYDVLPDAVAALIRAAAIARSVGSFEGALRYVEAGIELQSLSPTAHGYKRPLAELRCSVLLDIKGAAIEDNELELLLLESRTPLDTARAVRLQAAAFILRGRFEDAIDTSLAGLRCLGINLSRVPSPSEIQAAREMTATALEIFSLDRILEHPIAKDDTVVAAMDLLATLQSSFFSDDGLKFVHTAKIVELSAIHGVTGATCYGLSWCGVSLASYYGDYTEALAMAEAAVSLSSREAFRPYRTSSLVALDQVSVWSRPLSYALDRAKEAFEHGKNSGDLSMSCYAANHVVSNLLAMGAPLSVVINEASRGLALARSVGFDEVIQILQLQIAFAKAIRQGPSIEQRLLDVATQNKASQMSPLMFWGHLYEGISAFFRGDYQQTARSLSQAEVWKWTTPAHIHVADYHFYAAMTARMLGAGASGDVNRSAIAAFAAQNPLTFSNKLSLIDAEDARARGDVVEALRLYEMAIQSARAAGFSHELALAHERAGRLSLEVGLLFAGAEHLRQARASYHRWGAEHLTERLDIEFSGTIPQGIEADRPALSFERSRKVDALTTDLVVAAIKYSGAMRGQLISVDRGEMALIANSSVQHGMASLDATGLDNNEVMAPTSIIRMVVESARSLRYGHASIEAAEMHDLGSKDCPTRSVLCVPLMLNNEVFSILYLENNAVSDAFTYETEQAIELFVIATTEAIKLQTQLDMEAKHRSEKISKDAAFVSIRADMIKNSHVTVLGGMAASIVHEVNQPLSAIVTHASAGTRWLRQAAPQIEKAINNFTKIEESGVRASGIISALRSLAKQAPANLEFLDLRDVVSDVLGFLETDTRAVDVDMECALGQGGRIFADPIQVQQVVLNLITNALDAMEGCEDKALRVELEVRDNVVVLAVTDSGSGIPLETRKSIFDPFFTTKEKGLGMGLAICKTIAEVHGGTLALGGSNASGTTMVFTLPITSG